MSCRTETKQKLKQVGRASLLLSFPVFAYLETLSVFALPSSLSQKSLLFLLLFLFLQSPDVLLKTNEGIFFVHIYNHMTKNRRLYKSSPRSSINVQTSVSISLHKYLFLHELKKIKACFHTLQLFILCKGRVIQQVLLSLRPGGPICYISHVIQYVLKSFPVPLS